MEENDNYNFFIETLSNQNLQIGTKLELLLTYIETFDLDKSEIINLFNMQITKRNFMFLYLLKNIRIYESIDRFIKLKFIFNPKLDRNFCSLMLSNLYDHNKHKIYLFYFLRSTRKDIFRHSSVNYPLVSVYEKEKLRNNFSLIKNSIKHFCTKSNKNHQIYIDNLCIGVLDLILHNENCSNYYYFFEKHVIKILESKKVLISYLVNEIKYGTNHKSYFYFLKIVNMYKHEIAKFCNNEIDMDSARRWIHHFPTLWLDLLSTLFSAGIKVNIENIPITFTNIYQVLSFFNFGLDSKFRKNSDKFWYLIKQNYFYKGLDLSNM